MTPKRVGVAAVLVAMVIGALAAWFANALGASFAVEIVVLMAATYGATWIAILVGRRLVRSSRSVESEGG